MIQNLDIKAVLNQFIENALKDEEIYLKRGKVTAVNTSEYTYTMQPNDDSGEIEVDMNLAGASGEGITIIPSVNSLCIVGYTDKTEPVSLFIEDADVVEINGNAQPAVKGDDNITALNSISTNLSTLSAAIAVYANGAIALKPADPLVPLWTALAASSLAVVTSLSTTTATLINNTTTNKVKLS